MTASEPAAPHGSAAAGMARGRVASERSIADVALDLFVYAPAGALLTAASDMPAMAEKGRERIEQELRNAHVVGRFVLGMGARQVRGRLERLVGEPAPSPAPGPAAPATGAPRRPRATGPARAASSPPASTPGASTPGASTPPASTPGGGTTPAAATQPARDAAVDRAIPAYDTLSASQVVRRLDGLKARELRAVVRHELANRGRRTILHRAEQLLGEAPPSSPHPSS